MTEGLRPDVGIGPYIIDIDSILFVADFVMSPLPKKAYAFLGTP